MLIEPLSLSCVHADTDLQKGLILRNEKVFQHNSLIRTRQAASEGEHAVQMNIIHSTGSKDFCPAKGGCTSACSHTAKRTTLFICGSCFSSIKQVAEAVLSLVLACSSALEGIFCWCGASCVQEKAARNGFAHPGEDKASERPKCGLPVPDGSRKKDGGSPFFCRLGLIFQVLCRKRLVHVVPYQWLSKHTICSHFLE